MPTGAAGAGTAYAYESAPQAVKPGTKKYRDDDIAPLTLMSDPRVIRGSTHALARKIIAQGPKKAQTLRLAAAKKLPDPPTGRPSYKFDVPGFAEEELDIFQYLTDGIDLDNKPSNSAVKTSQTDEFKERPPSPKYVPRKTGVDKDTQVEDVQELFNFDLEVAPMLDVIVSKTLEQALFELDAEEELRRIKAHIGEFNLQLAEESKWVVAKEEESKASVETMRVAFEVKRAEQKGKDKLRTLTAGAQMVREIMPAFLDELAEELIETGVWVNPPAVANETREVALLAAKRADLYTCASEVLDEILGQAQDMYHDKVPEYTPIVVEPTVIRVVVEKTKLGEEATEDVVLELTVEGGDTILDLEKRTRQGLADKGVPAGVVRTRLGIFIEGVVGRKVADDARLLNFKDLLPQNLHIVLDSP